MRQKTRLFLLFSARAGSTRVKNKMLRPMGDGKSLLDVYLARMSPLLASGLFVNGGFAVCPKDPGLYVKVMSAGVPAISRTEASTEKGAPLNTIFSCLQEIGAEYVLWVNGCQPFLKNETILNAASNFHDAPCSMTSVVAHKEVLWKGNSPLFDDAKQHRSEHAELLYRSSHSFHIFNRRYLLSMSQYWEATDGNPRLFVIDDHKEVLDADSELDFSILSALRRPPCLDR